MPNTLTDADWELLLQRINNRKCTPFLGAGACYGILPLGSRIAEDWAAQHEYPLDDKWDLAQVAQFLATTRDPMRPKEQILAQFKNVAPPDFNQPDEPHAVLASLPLPIYITTNYDNFMMKALENQKRDPVREVCRWNEATRQKFKNQRSIFEARPPMDFNKTPVVFHLHGHSELAESLVLTEDDYLEFLVSLSKDKIAKIIPLDIQGALAGTSLLFLGYKIADWDFRVLYKSLVGYMNINTQYSHVSVQLEPVNDDAQKERARKYLDRYFGKRDVRVYWGTCREFAAELRQRWEAFPHGN